MTDYVALSGGVDSTALALLMPHAELVFTDTGWEFPELYAHLDRIEAVTGRAITRIQSHRGSLPDIIRLWRMMPGHGARFCTRESKIEPFNRFLRDKAPAALCIGLRADEERTGNTGVGLPEGISIRYPLREMGMTRGDVLTVCLARDLLPRYPIYMSRGGCVGCFYKRKSEVTAMVHLRPDVMDELQALEEEVQDRREKYAVLFPSIGMSIREFRQQPLLFDVEQVYGDALRRDEMTPACGLFCNR